MQKHIKVAPSPYLGLKDGRKTDRLPKIHGGKCEFSGMHYKDAEACPWFKFVSLLKTTREGSRELNVPIVPYGDTSLPDNLSADLNNQRDRLLKEGKILIEKPKAKRKPRKEAEPKVEEKKEEKPVEVALEVEPVEPNDAE